MIHLLFVFHVGSAGVAMETLAALFVAVVRCVEGRRRAGEEA